jgi:coenzyme F420-dependent glucose-6-phosphate dehydrogenase
MPHLGYSLSSEEVPPRELVRNAVRAEETGFNFAMISDHFHPWLDVQGQSPFVWGVIGGIASSTQNLKLGTGVTCPIIRIHPAILAQAAATSADLMPGRFWFGIGSGENLNEHVVGHGWPPVDVRHEMLREAIEVLRELWKGHLTDYRGQYFTVENARIYSLPEQPPPIYVAASGMAACEIATEMGDGLITTGPDKELIEHFTSGNNGPRLGQVTVAYTGSLEESKKLAFKYWPNAALKGTFKMELPLPLHFQEASSTLTEDQVAEAIVCDPSPEAHMEKIEAYLEAGFDHVYVHQVGPEQEGFFRFYKEEILPRFREKHGDRVATAA